jgi:Sec-independent protein translocase protein TatA
MAEKKIIEIGADVGDALKEIKNLFKTMVEEEKKAQKQTEATTEAVKEIGTASKKTLKGVQSISKGFKGLGVAIKAAGIGLLISAMASVKEIFSQNQRVVDAFSIAFETFSGVVNQVVSALFNVYDVVSKSKENFNGLTKVISGLLTIGLTPLKLTFYGIKLALQQTQLAWEKSFFGDKDPETIKTLNEGIKETKDNLIEVGTEALKAGKDIYENIGDAFGEISNIGALAIDELSKVSVKSAFEQAKSVTELRKSAEIAAEIQAGLVEENDRLAEQQRQIRDNDLLSIKDRKKANEELLKILEKQKEDMLKQAELQTAAAQAEYNRNKTTENYVALLAAQNNEKAVEAQIEGFLSEQKQNAVALQKEEIELTNTQLESQSKLSIEKQRFDAEQIENKLARLQKLKKIDALEAEQEALRLQQVIDNANAGTQAKIDAQIVLDEFLEQSRQQNITREKEIAEEKSHLKTQEKEREIALAELKKNLVNQGLDAVIGAAGAESKVGRALFIAKQALALKELVMNAKTTLSKATMNAAESGTDLAKGAGKAASSLPPPFNLIPIAVFAAQAVGIVSSMRSAMQKTKAATAKAGGGGSVGSVSAPSSGGAAAAPSFNIVGQGATNQLASAISNQNDKPIKAYVTSSDVTTAQSMDRNIVQGATI